MIEIKCSNCGETLKAPDELAGKKARCSGCQKILVIPKQVDDIPVLEVVNSAEKLETKVSDSSPTYNPEQLFEHVKEL